MRRSIDGGNGLRGLSEGLDGTDGGGVGMSGVTRQVGDHGMDTGPRGDRNLGPRGK